MGQTKADTIALCDLVRFCKDNNFTGYRFTSDDQSNAPEPISFVLYFDEIKADEFLGVVGFIGQSGSVSVYGVKNILYRENPRPVLILESPRRNARYVFSVNK